MAASDAKATVHGHPADAIATSSGVGLDGQPLFVIEFEFEAGPGHRMVVRREEALALASELNDWVDLHE